MKHRRKLEERFFMGLMRLSLGMAAAVLILILAVITWRGIGALSLEMISQPPHGNFYVGGGGRHP